jgi:hypothetical protein
MYYLAVSITNIWLIPHRVYYLAVSVPNVWLIYSAFLSFSLNLFFFLLSIPLLSVGRRGSSVGIAMGYGLDGRGLIPAGTRFFFSPQRS